MPSTKVKVATGPFLILIFVLASMMAIAAFANESAAPAEGGGEAAAEGGGEAAPKPEGSGADREWAKRTSKLNVLETKMADLTKQIQELIEAKNHSRMTKDEKGNPVDALEKIAELHKKLGETTETYNTEKSELKYRYPEEGALIERRYLPRRTQTLDQIERELGLNGELTRTKKKIDKKYATFTETPDQVKPEVKSVVEDPTYKQKLKPGEEAPTRLKLSK